MGSKDRLYVDIQSLHPEVTGSCNLCIVKYPNGETTRFIVDCGLFQEAEYSEYNKSFPFDADKIEFALVTHNHVDHLGRLPLLAKQGFSGKIYTTKTTALFAPLALYDSYKVLKDVAKRNHESPIYSEANVSEAVKHIEGCEFRKPQYVDKEEHIKVIFFENGHLLGAACILVQVKYPEYDTINLLFTGDYSPRNIFFDVPELPKWVKEIPLTVVQESTYGDMGSEDIVRSFKANVIKCLEGEGEGTIVCPVFSLGRSQEILYFLKRMQEDGELDTEVPIYFDGKLAHQYTSFYLKEDIGIKEEMQEFLPENLVFVTKENRKDVLYSTAQKIIVTTSGMGTYGPAQLYIPEYIIRKNSLIHFTGYVTEGTLGRRLKDTPNGEIVTIAGALKTKRAKVEYTNEFSAHAKADEMLDFLKQFSNLKLVLVNHGETAVKEQFAKRVVKEVDPKDVAILNRTYFFRINPYGLVRSLSTKFD